MPNVAPKDYLPRLDQFLDHWRRVDQELDEPLVIPGGYDRRRLAEDREGLAEQIDVVQRAETRVARAIAARNQLRAELGERQRQFNALSRALIVKPAFAARLVRVPVPTSGPEVWMTALEEVAALWEEAEAIAEVRLAGGFTREDFERDRAELVRAYEAMDAATADYRMAAETRDALWAPIYQRLRTYRLMVQGLFASEATLARDLPKLITPYRRASA